jgi:hypothetical protein
MSSECSKCSGPKRGIDKGRAGLSIDDGVGSSPIPPFSTYYIYYIL